MSARSNGKSKSTKSTRFFDKNYGDAKSRVTIVKKKTPEHNTSVSTTSVSVRHTRDPSPTAFWEKSKVKQFLDQFSIEDEHLQVLKHSFLHDIRAYASGATASSLALLTQIRTIAESGLGLQNGIGYKFVVGSIPDDMEPDAVKAWRRVFETHVDAARLEIYNSVDLEGPPSDFSYISQNKLAKSLREKRFKEISKCSCKTRCGPSCSCRFSVDDSTTRECHEQCGCFSNCGNRTVQLGRTVGLQIYRTANVGWTVRTLEAIKKNAFVAEYVGLIIPIKKVKKIISNPRIQPARKRYFFDLDFHGQKHVEYSINSFRLGNVTRFLNHSCDPNLFVKVVFTKTDCLGRICFFALKDIPAQSELTIDYAGKTILHSNSTSDIDSNSSDSDDSEHVVFEKCHCGSEKCRGNIWT